MYECANPLTNYPFRYIYVFGNIAVFNIFRFVFSFAGMS